MISVVSPKCEGCGLRCPRCRCHTFRTLYTRRKTNKIDRVRECKGCKHRVRTHEEIGTGTPRKRE